MSTIPVPADCPPPVPTPSPTPGGGSTGGLAATVVPLCDAGTDPATEFLLHTAYTAGGAPSSSTATLLDGTTPYVPVGPVSENCPCEALNVVPHQDELTGAGQTLITSPTGVTSVSVFVRVAGAAGSVTITTTDGSFPGVTGETYSWAVIRDQEDRLGSVQIDTSDAGDDVLVLWTEAV